MFEERGLEEPPSKFDPFLMFFLFFLIFYLMSLFFTPFIPSLFFFNICFEVRLRIEAFGRGRDLVLIRDKVRVELRGHGSNI